MEVIFIHLWFLYLFPLLRKLFPSFPSSSCFLMLWGFFGFFFLFFGSGEVIRFVC